MHEGVWSMEIKCGSFTTDTTNLKKWASGSTNTRPRRLRKSKKGKKNYDINLAGKPPNDWTALRYVWAPLDPSTVHMTLKAAYFLGTTMCVVSSTLFAYVVPT